MMEKGNGEGKNRIIVPLDVDTEEKAWKLINALTDEVGAFKVGLELLNAVGSHFVDALVESGDRVFFDGKFHDIPNTVAGAARGATNRGVWMFNVHCGGGLAMMKAAKEASLEEAAKLGITPPLVMGVTVLTSIDQAVLNNELGISGEVADHVARRARLAKTAGLDGVIASPLEIEVIRDACGPDFLITTPGVRPAGADTQDQKRVMTPGEAASRGADFLVIGRPISGAEDPAKAAAAIAAEIDEAEVQKATAEVS